MRHTDNVNNLGINGKLQDEAYEQVNVLLDQIKRLKSEIKSREETITSLCKTYEIDAVLDC